MTGQVRLDHVVIAVSDWDRSIAFHRDALRAQVVDNPDGRVAFRFGTNSSPCTVPIWTWQPRRDAAGHRGRQRPLLRLAGQ